MFVWDEKLKYTVGKNDLTHRPWVWHLWFRRNAIMCYCIILIWLYVIRQCGLVAVSWLSGCLGSPQFVLSFSDSHSVHGLVCDSLLPPPPQHHHWALLLILFPLVFYFIISDLCVCVCMCTHSIYPVFRVNYGSRLQLYHVCVPTTPEQIELHILEIVEFLITF